jgi:hypothetical protein
MFVHSLECYTCYSYDTGSKTVSRFSAIALTPLSPIGSGCSRPFEQVIHVAKSVLGRLGADVWSGMVRIATDAGWISWSPVQVNLWHLPLLG